MPCRSSFRARTGRRLRRDRRSTRPSRRLRAVRLVDGEAGCRRRHAGVPFQLGTRSGIPKVPRSRVHKERCERTCHRGQDVVNVEYPICKTNARGRVRIYDHPVSAAT